MTKVLDQKESRLTEVSDLVRSSEVQLQRIQMVILQTCWCCINHGVEEDHRKNKDIQKHCHNEESPVSLTTNQFIESQIRKKKYQDFLNRIWEDKKRCFVTQVASYIIKQIYQ